MLGLTGGAVAAGLAGCIGDDGDDNDYRDTTDGQEDPHADVAAQVDAYVVAYHWGYAVFDDHGEEVDRLEVEPNTEVTIHAVNDHAYDAFEALPDPVAGVLEDFDALGRTKAKVEAGELPEPSGTTVEEAYQEAHGGGHDHAHDDDDHGHDDEDAHDDDGHGHDDDDHGHGDDDHGHRLGQDAEVELLHGESDDGHGHDEDDDGHDHAGGKLDHGFMIPDLDVSMQLPADADQPATETVEVAEPGTYEAMCTIPCGYYHGEQRGELVHVTE